MKVFLKEHTHVGEIEKHSITEITLKAKKKLS